MKVARPDRIILFGSAARGAAGPESDVDLLVVKRGEFHSGRLTEEICMNLIGVAPSVDVVVATPEDLERYGSSGGMIFASALREGKEVYAV